MNINLERGVKRIFVTISGLGFIGVILGVLFLARGLIDQDKHDIEVGWAFIATGIGWFVFFLISSFVIAWIIRGFRKDEPEDKTDST